MPILINFDFSIQLRRVSPIDACRASFLNNKYFLDATIGENLVFKAFCPILMAICQKLMSA